MLKTFKMLDTWMFFHRSYSTVTITVENTVTIFIIHFLKEFHDMRSWNFVQVGELNNHGNTLDNQMQKCKGIHSLDRTFLFPTKVFLSNETIISKCLAAWNVIL